MITSLFLRLLLREESPEGTLLFESNTHRLNTRQEACWRVFVAVVTDCYGVKKGGILLDPYG